MTEELSIEQLESQLAKKKREKAEATSFKKAVDAAAQDKLSATHQAMIAMEKKRHEQSIADINDLFKPKSNDESTVPDVFRGSVVGTE